MGSRGCSFARSSSGMSSRPRIMRASGSIVSGRISKRLGIHTLKPKRVSE